MNLINTSTNSPQYFYWKRKGITNENLNFNVNDLRDLGRPFHIRAAVLANRSLSFSLVSEQRKTDEGHFRISQREKWNESHPLPALSLAQFLARSLTLVPRCLLRNQTETLATQASFSFPLKSMVWCHQEVILWKTNGPVVQVPCTSWNRLD